jgi:hypothetical protein
MLFEDHAPFAVATWIEKSLTTPRRIEGFFFEDRAHPLLLFHPMKVTTGTADHTKRLCRA